MDFKQRLEQGNEMPNGKELLSEPENNNAGEFFGIANQATSPACLDLRLKSGNRKAIPYSFFTEINYNIEAGIEIFTTTKRIIINGRNLSKLFDYLATYRVRYVQASVGSDPKEDGLFVKDIMIEEL
jgi:hypothetical protein